MTAVRFNGHDTMTYPDHIDLATGKTLVAVPGQSYATAAAPGRNPGLPAVPGDSRWGSPGVAAPAPVLRREPVTVPPVPPGEPPETNPAPPEDAASPESEG